MMESSALSPTVAPASTSTVSASSMSSATSSATSSLQNANFMQIMLAEITTQDPTQPEDTSQMVQEMQEMQQLSNTQEEAYQDNLKFAQNLIGQTVNVQEQSIDATTQQSEISQGLNPAVGSATNSGTVSSFKDIGQQVYVTVNGQDYPIANVTQVVPATDNPATLSTIAAQLLGKTVGYSATTGANAIPAGSGVVSGVSYDSNGNVQLTIGGSTVPYKSITQINSSS